MNKIPTGVKKSRIKLVPDNHYPSVLRQLISQVIDRCYCSLFIVDLSTVHDIELQVDALLRQLRMALWRGVDVKLLIGGSRTNLDLLEMSALAYARAQQLGIPCCWLTRKSEESSHTKMVVADENVLIGSHNWSGGAFTNQTQDSVLIKSKDLSTFLLSGFLKTWERALEEE